ncbi:MAG: hypothetical protein MUO58_18155 [Anaerolineales bacterium]|nr:hypothetical protein [Anaerolineales bacterium]
MICDRLLQDGAGGENNKRWQRHPDNPILRPTPGTWAGEWIANETVIQVGDEYLMYLDGKSGPVERIGVARAKVEGFDGVHWEEYSGNPVLDIGPGGYDHTSVLDPSVISYQGELLMYYTGIGGPPDQICLARSENGFDWTKDEHNPILSGRCPHVVLREEILYLFYLVYNEDGGYDVRLATSQDGVSFEKHSQKPILPRGSKGEWDWFSVVTTRILEEDGIYQMFYAADAERVDEPHGFGIAISRDLVNWEKFAGNPIFLTGEPGEWDSEAIWCPWVIRSGNEYWMWYCGSRTTYSQGLTPQAGLAILA